MRPPRGLVALDGPWEQRPSPPRPSSAPGAQKPLLAGPAPLLPSAAAAVLWADAPDSSERETPSSAGSCSRLWGEFLWGSVQQGGRPCTTASVSVLWEGPKAGARGQDKTQGVCCQGTSLNLVLGAPQVPWLPSSLNRPSWVCETAQPHTGCLDLEELLSLSEHGAYGAHSPCPHRGAVVNCSGDGEEVTRECGAAPGPRSDTALPPETF